jgi:hypothetical protein
MTDPKQWGGIDRIRNELLDALDISSVLKTQQNFKDVLRKRLEPLLNAANESTTSFFKEEKLIEEIAKWR